MRLDGLTYSRLKQERHLVSKIQPILQMLHGTFTIKRFTAVSVAYLYKARVFATAIHFHPTYSNICRQGWSLAEWSILQDFAVMVVSQPNGRLRS
jgi:hypothetical protein